jgi:hypothetical protein
MELDRQVTDLKQIGDLECLLAELGANVSRGPTVL